MQTDANKLVKQYAVRFNAEHSDQIDRIAEVEERKPAAVLRRLVAKALKSERVK